ncbi:sodium:solute symporter family transporter [Rubellicoccus peritrichatus]|uniref:Sodium:solute symporter n=1 Tax=Rubellicoccus peritrichatus TaxID=3080537 RepID=A0AAQ3LF43_9BACT|nr:hypothetical protein [Puniceicoccus sp. CR14]WOO43567.1 hypothetical protein RZN69_10755 [Puniceicoccus sp. CR14]
MIVEWVIIGIYLVLLVIMGAWFGKLNTNTSDYFRSGQRGTWWLVGLSMVMAGTSTRTFTGNAGLGYEAGFTFLIIYWSGLLLLPVEYFVIAPMFRRLRATTSAEVVRERFGAGTEQLVAYLRVVTFLFFGGAWLWGLAIFISSVFGLPMVTMIVVLGLVVMFYSTTGGKWAVMGTDFIQGLIMISMCLLLGYICLDKLGGFSGMFQAITDAGLWEEFLPIKSDDMADELYGGKYQWRWIVALFISSAMWRFSMGSAERFFSVKHEKEAKKVVLVSLCATPLAAFYLIPDITARLLYSDQVSASLLSKPAESAFAIASINLLPQGLIGMMVIAMFAASMSSLDTGMNGNAAMIMKNIYPPLSRLFGKSIVSEEKQLFASKILSLILGAIIISVALYLSDMEGVGMFEILMDMNAILTPPILVPTMLGLFIRKTPKCAGLVSIVTGAIVGIVALVMAKMGMPWSYEQKVFIILGFSITAFLLTMPFYKRSSKEYLAQVDQFFLKMRTPIDFAKEVGEANDHQQLKMLGFFASCLGGFVLSLCVIPGNDMQGRIYIVALATMILMVGLPMLYLGRKKTREFELKHSQISKHNDANVLLPSKTEVK